VMALPALGWHSFGKEAPTEWKDYRK